MNKVEDYKNSVNSMKHEIFDAVKGLLKVIDSIEFKDPFYIYHCNGEVAITEIAKEIWIRSDGSVVLKVTNIEGNPGIIVLDECFEVYNVSSLIDILGNMRKAMRDEMVLSLIERVRDGGSSKRCFTTNCDGTGVTFTLEILINGDIELIVGDSASTFVSDLPFESLTEVYEKVNKSTSTWKIRLLAYVDRNYTVNAATWDDAVEEAKRRFHNESVSHDEITFEASEYD